MSNKLSIEDIVVALQKSGIEHDKQVKVLDFLEAVVKEEQEQKIAEKLPKSKSEFGIVIYDAENKLQGLELTGSIYTVPVNTDHNLVLAKISDAAREQTVAAKRKKLTIDSIGLAFQVLKRKFIKDKQVMLKTKEVVRVIISNNKLV